MKRILLIALCLILFILAGCGEENGEKSEASQPNNTTDTSSSQTSSSQKDTAIKVSGKSYKADTGTINLAWDKDGKEPTQYEIDTFKTRIKVEFANSVIRFTDESSFTLTGTNNQIHDISVENCERIENELFKEISRGSVDIIINEDKISFLFDFYTDWYVSIDYNIIK